MDEERVRAVWEGELDRLEIDVIRAERLLKGLSALPVEAWDPPMVPGQMPADLAARAQVLLDRQEQAIAELAVGLTAAQKQIRYAARVTATHDRSGVSPVYLDLDA